MFEIIIFGGFVYFVYLIGKDSGKTAARAPNPTQVLELPSGKKAVIPEALVKDLQRVKRHLFDEPTPDGSPRDIDKRVADINAILRKQGFSRWDIDVIVEGCGISPWSWNKMLEFAGRF